MKTIHVPFTDEEHGVLNHKKGKLTWHEFIMSLVTRDDIMAYRDAMTIRLMGESKEETQ